MTRTIETREQWLNAFIKLAAPVFEQHGTPLPRVRASIGFTSKGARGSAIGQCWSKECSADDVFEIFIVPGIEDASRIADILTHELVHAAVGIEASHGPIFRKLAVALGLEGKMTATVAGDGWRAWADPILEQIGDWPAAPLNARGPSSGPKKQGTRLLKAECQDCGFTMRTTAKWIEAADGALQCPDRACSGAMLVS